MNNKSHFHITIILALVLAIFFSGLARSSALADMVKCRSDPLVVLSNGTVLDISAGVGTWMGNITNIDYVLHVPEGVSVIVAISTPNWPTVTETFTVIADNPPGKYTSVTTVQTTVENVEVTANMIVLRGLLRLYIGSVDGWNGDALTLSTR